MKSSSIGEIAASRLKATGIEILGVRMLSPTKFLLRGRLCGNTVRYFVWEEGGEVRMRRVTTTERKQLGRKYKKCKGSG